MGYMSMRCAKRARK